MTFLIRTNPLRRGRSRRAAVAAAATLATTGVLVSLPVAGATAAQTQVVLRSTAQAVPVTDAAGNTWASDAPYAFGGTRSVTTSSIRGAYGANTRLYQAARIGIRALRVPVPAPGTYQVKLYFADQSHGTAGRRVFDVVAEGALKANDLDVAKEVGRLSAHQRWFSVPVVDATLDLGFVPVVGSTMLSAIEVNALDVAVQTPTTAVTSPAPAPATTVAAPLWRGDYETGTFSAFETAPWNFVPQGPSVVQSPVRDGRHAGRYVIPAGGSRNESVPLGGRIREGDERWYALSTRLGDDFPVAVSNWQVLSQWKNDGTGSPPLELSVANNQYSIGGGYGHPSGPRLEKRVLGAARTGVWEDWLIHVRFSSNPAVGSVEVWRNGQQVLGPWSPKGGTLYPGLASYHKVGYYRDSGIRHQGTVYLDRLATGLSRSSVGG